MELGADEGDTKTIQETVAEAGERITSLVADTDNDEDVKQVSAEGPREVVTDKGYHRRAVVSELTEWGRAHVLFGAESWAAAVARSADRATRGVCESPPHSRRTRPPIIAATRREAGAVESTLV